MHHRRSWVAAVGVLALLAGCQDERAATPAAPEPGGAQQQQPKMEALGSEPRTGWIAVDGKAVPLVYREYRGRAIQGDVALAPIDAVAPTPEEALRRAALAPRLALGVGSTAQTWPGARVPYYMGNVTNAQAVRDAMAKITAQTGIRFVARTTETTYLEIYNNSVCGGFYDGVGNSGNRVLYMTTCSHNGKAYQVALHELGHSLGLRHEHQRCDRDNHITLDTLRIKASGVADQYYKLCSGTSYWGSAYDLSSIMHYGSNDWGTTHFTTKTGGIVAGFWARSDLSPTDVATLKTMYGLSGSTGVSGTTACTGGYCGPYNLRTGPGTGYATSGTVNGGVAVTILCQTTGTSHTGPWGTTSLWNKLGGAYNGKWISDAFVYTGSASAVAPRC